MSYSLNHYPAARLFIPFAVGIVAGSLVHCSRSALVLIISLIILASLLQCEWSGLSKQYSKRWVYGVLVQVFLSVSGFASVVIQNEVSGRSSVVLPQKDALVCGIIESEPDLRNGNARGVLRISAIKERTKWVSASGMFLVAVPNDSTFCSLCYGDRIVCEINRASRINGPMNPGDFDYRKFLASQGIRHKLILKRSHWQKVVTAHSFSLTAFAFDLRKKLIAVFAAFGVHGEEKAVLSALVLGFTGEIPDAVKTSFSRSGVIHILSVSGMHVGIIYAVFAFFLAFLEKKRTGRIMRYILLLSFLWFFALLTGLSPAVLRASMMFSLILTGRFLGKQTEVWNIIFASLLLLLVQDHTLLFNAGLQLSYLSVMGILFFYPSFYNVFEFRHKWLDQGWSLISVSLAAQLATFILCLYYFGQFPVYFLIANLIVVPLSSLIIYSGLVLFVLSPFVTWLKFIGMGVQWLVYALDQVCAFIERLPYSAITGAYTGLAQTMFLYAILVFGFLWIREQVKRYVFVVLICWLGLETVTAYNTWRFSNEKEVLFFSSRKGMCVMFRKWEEAVFVRSGDVSDIQVAVGRQERKLRKYSHLSFDENPLTMPHFKTTWIEMQGGVIGFAGRRFLITGGNHIPSSVESSLFDQIVVTGAEPVSETFLRKVHAANIILPGSLSFKACKTVEARCERTHIPCTVLRNTGAIDLFY